LLGIAPGALLGAAPGVLLGEALCEASGAAGVLPGAVLSEVEPPLLHAAVSARHMTIATMIASIFFIFSVSFLYDE